MMRQLRLFHLETALTHEHERRQRLEWYLRELMFERQTLQEEDVLSSATDLSSSSSTLLGSDSFDESSILLSSGVDLNSYELGSGLPALAGPSDSFLLSPRKVTVSPAEIFGSASIDSISTTAAEYSQSLAVCAAKLNKKLGSSTGSLPLAVQPSIRKSGRRNPQQRVAIRKLAKSSSSFAFAHKFDSDRACESDDNDDYEDGNSDAEPIEEASAEEEEDEFTTGSADADDESELSQESNDCEPQDSDLAVMQRWERLLKASQQKDKEGRQPLRPRRKLGSSFDSVGSSSSPISSSPSSPVTFSFEQPAIEI